MRIIDYTDTVTETIGKRVTDPYVEMFWLPILGPTATLLARRLTHLVGREHPDERLAAELGVSVAVLERSVQRLVRYDVASQAGDVVAIRSHLPRVPLRLRNQLPGHLVAIEERVQ